MSPAATSRLGGVDRGQPRAEVVLLRDGREVATWPLLCARAQPDLGLVDEVARLHLAATRLGCSIRLRAACPDLVRLLDLAGLHEIVGPACRPPPNNSGR